MGCIFRARINQLWSVWYTIAILLLQTYLLYLGFERYRLYSEMKWPHGAYPRIWLSVYVILYSVCIPALLLFAAFGIFKSGNIAGDNDRLGARIDRIIEMSTKSNSAMWRVDDAFCATMQVLCQERAISADSKAGMRAFSRGCSPLRKLKSIWQHSPPLPQQIHLLMALLQLFAQQIMLAQLYRYGFINSGDFLNTELDFVYQRARQLATNLPMLDTRLQGFRISAHDLAGTPIGPNLLPRQYLSSSKPLKIYHPLAIIATYVTTMVLINIAPIALYTYGYNKYFVNLMALQYKNSARNQGTSVNGPPSEYSEYRRRSYQRSPAAKLCCDGYAPHIIAIVLLVLIVIVKAPTIYALMVLYQHEEKSLLLSCIVIDITYLFTWIIFWLILTLKRDWNFKVVHQMREIIALQNAHKMLGAATGSVCDKNPSELKNAVLLMHGDQMYITDDPVAKQSVLRHAQKSGMDGSACTDEVYWLKTNGAQSPTTRKIPLNENNKGTPEMNRLLGGNAAAAAIRRQSADDNISTPADAYHSIRRTPASQTNSQSAIAQPLYGNTEGSPHEERTSASTFGTLQRNQRVEYVATLNRPTMTAVQQRPVAGQQQNSMNMSALTASDYGRGQIAHHQSEAYASIHKSSPRGVAPVQQLNDSAALTVQRRGSAPRDDSADNSTYSNLGASYASTYSAYGHIPPSQTRALQNQQISQQAAAIAGARNANNAYGMQQKFQVSVSQRLPTDGIMVAPSSMGSVRASPLIGEDRITNARSTATSREQSPYQRSTNLKLSSFNSAMNTSSTDAQKHVAAHSTLPIAWSQQQRAQMAQNSAQSQTVQWASNSAYNKASSISTSSSQADQCFTPTSTLTSQGSVSNYSSQHTPTPGSPNLGPSHSNALYGTHTPSSSASNARHAVTVANANIYGNIGDESNNTESTYGTITSADRLVSSTNASSQPPPVAQKPLRSAAVATGSTSIRHQVKMVTSNANAKVTSSRQDDSANYSLTSSYESAENPRQGNMLAQTTAEYATSIV
ncbi:unnamed protein product [Anisakis simplex]|uniref:Protein tincar (inferred by orthology to a D. melanogaster protein) n=1 Tax=Anisakis simplex TaxID=6269 RepID=A0A0M3JWL6_ANISI|nr:unnamed protein product [Anisakis simplex]